MRSEGGLIQKMAMEVEGGHKMDGVQRGLVRGIRKACLIEYRGSW